MNLHSPAAPEFEMEPAPRATASWIPQAAANALDLRRWAFAFMRRWRLLAAVGLVIFAFVLLKTLTTTPLYTATASVALDMRKEQVTSDQQVLSDLPAEGGVVDTEVEVLKSRQLADRVVQALQLDQDPEFNPAVANPSGVGALVSGIEQLIGGSAPRQTQLSPIQVQRRHDAVVTNVMRRVQVKRLGLTYVIEISFTSTEPAKATRIANKYADLYLLEQLQEKFEATQQATNWLNNQLDQLRQQAERDDAAVQQFKIENNLLSSSGSTFTEQEISTYNQTLAQAQAQLAEDQARLSAAQMQLGRASNGADIGAALDSPLIQALRSHRAEVSAQIADLQTKYGERYPDMVKAKRQLADIDAQIQQEIHTIVASLQARVEVSRQRVAAVEGSLGGAKGSLAANNRAMVRLNELQRTADASKAIYESYLNRYKETSSQEGLGTPDARVISRAALPTAPSAPNITRNLMLGLMLALAGGSGAVVLAETLDAGLATAEDVERRLGLSYLGSIPLLSSVAPETQESPFDYIVSKPLSSFSEAFRSVEASILHARLDEPSKVVALTSALPSEGKTITSMALARTAALQGRRVLIMDCDLRRRNVNRLVSEKPRTGLLEVLSGEATLQQALQVDAPSGLHVLPLADATYTPKNVFGSASMDRLLAEVRGRYDLIFLDTAPVLPVADTRVIAPKADLVVMLTRWRKTPEPAVQAALRLINTPDIRLAGIVLTMVDMKQQSRYGYGDPGYYYSEYKKYYTS